jgi:hypothetical protein
VHPPSPVWPVSAGASVALGASVAFGASAGESVVGASLGLCASASRAPPSEVGLEDRSIVLDASEIGLAESDDESVPPPSVVVDSELLHAMKPTENANTQALKAR